MLEIKNIHANIDGKDILKGIDLEIKPGFKVQWYAIRLKPPGQ